MRKTTWYIVTMTLCTGVGVFIWYHIPKITTPTIEEDSEAIHQSWYTFINPLIECETRTTGNNQKYIPFEKKLTANINEIIQKNPTLTTAVYFRNLRNGPWFWINENIDFSPASLMKLPLLIMYLRWSEIESKLLDKKLTVNVWNSLWQSYIPQESILSWASYSIDELLRHLIIYSDNSASNTLIDNIPHEFQKKVFTDLGIPQPDKMDYVVSVKEYASFFRVLYNASYLSRENSEKALSLLSDTIFTWGITGKIPKEIKVAHKFWERELLDTDGKIINQLHDCGIVYYDKYPYLLCIMTRWKTPISTLSEEIQDISKTIFDEISSIYK